jgi:CDP-diacylglycerol--glycerol-3-phosphate 3-phosphatidyltransferase
MSEVSREAVDAGKLKGSRFLSTSIRTWWVHEVMRPIEDFFARHAIHPNSITTLGLMFSILAGVLIGMDHLIWGGWVVIWGGCCDFLDGRIARRMNLSSESGSFYDSVLDRYQDAAVFFGLAYLFRNSWAIVLVALGFLGTMTTPYIRAKAESLGLQARGGEMQRPERIVYVGLGSALAGYMSCLRFPFIPAGSRPPHYILMIAIGIVAWSSNKVAIQRAVGAFRELKKRG